MTRLARIAVFLSLAFGSVIAGDAMAQGCAMCGTATGDASDPLARSISASVLFMMSMPFLIFFSVAGWIVWRFRRARGARGTNPVKENPS